ACVANRLVVEADGGQHDPATDAARTARIAAAGWRVVRFWNNEVLANPEGVVLAILTALGEQPRRDRCRAAIKVRRRDNQGEKAFCRLRRREGGARPEAQAAEELTGSPPGGRIVW
ncbi:MAG: DUF559 domain-containing protein, partial [Pseudolabrys sp.]